MPRLQSIREELGFTSADVARAAGWAVEHVRAIERADELTEDDCDVLTRLYGLDVASAIIGEDGDATRQPLRALLRGPADALPADERFAIAEVATIAREHRALLHALGRRDRWPVIESFRDDNDYGHPAQGNSDRLAQAVRERLGLGDAPIPSVWELARRELGVLIVWVDVREDIDAFALAGPDTGAVIALNVAGAHTGSAFGRRVTLAHELCHVLFDRPVMRSMDRFCAIVRASGRTRRLYEPPLEERIERRARSFAACLLVPREAGIASWTRLRDRSTPARVRDWMTHWGIGYEAARAHLDSLGRLPITDRLRRVATDIPPVWAVAEPDAPRAGPTPLPLSRRGDFFSTVLDAVREQAISPARARDLLRLTRPAWDSLLDQIDAPPLRERSPEVSSSVLADWL